MKTIHFRSLLLFLLLVALGCDNNVEFDPGPFARDKDEDKTMLVFNVSDATGNPVEGAYVVAYRQLSPLHVRVGEGYTDQAGKIEVEDESDSEKGYATVVAPGYNSRKITLDIEPNQENSINVTMSNQDVLKVMSYNILMGFNNDAQLRQQFANWVAVYDPDIILFQEAANFTAASFEAFAKTFGHDHAVLAKTFGIPTGITSKEEITNIRKVIRTGILHHGYVTGETSGVRVFSVHLCPFEVDDERNTHNIARKDEAKIIMDDAAQYTAAPVVIGGDFNDHNTFDRDSYGDGYRYADRDHTVYNTVKGYNYHDTYPSRNSDFKATWPVAEVSVNGPNKGARIDYIFVSNNMSNSVVFSDIVHSSYTDKFSDHYPTYIEIKR